MQVNLPDQTLHDVEILLTKQGKDVDVPAFIDQTLRRALFFAKVNEVKQQNADVDAKQLQAEIDETVAEIRAQAR